MNRLKKIRDWFYFKENGDLKLYVESEDETGEVTGQNYSVGGAEDVSESTVSFSKSNNYNITSGSTLSTLFGKIKYFISYVVDALQTLTTKISNITTLLGSGNNGDVFAVPDYGSTDEYGWFSKEELGIKYGKMQAWNGQWYWYKFNVKQLPNPEDWNYSVQWTAADKFTIKVTPLTEHSTWFTLNLKLYVDEYESPVSLAIDSVSDPNANASINKMYDYMPVGLASFSLEKVTLNQEVTVVVKVTASYFNGVEIVGQEPYDLLFRDPAQSGYNYMIPANSYGRNGDALRTNDPSSVVGFGWSSPSKAFGNSGEITANLADSDLVNGWLKFQMPHTLSWYGNSSEGNYSGTTTMRLNLNIDDPYLTFRHPGTTGNSVTNKGGVLIVDSIDIENFANCLDGKSYAFPMDDSSNNTHCLGIVSFSAEPTSDMIYVKLEKYVNGAITPIKISSSYGLYFE